MSAVRLDILPDIDQTQAVLDAFGGNALAALQSVIADAEFLCDHLEWRRGCSALALSG